MSDKWKFILIFVVLIGSITLFLSLYFIFFGINRPGPGGDSGSKVDVAAQDFGLPNLRGDYVKLSDYRGKMVFLNFWATWCLPCREEMPSMESLYRRLKNREFEILAVSIDREGEKVVRPFVAKYGLTFPMLLDPESKIYRLYGLTGIPGTFIIDKKGVILLRIVGAQNWMEKEWLDYFDVLTAKKQEILPHRDAAR
jgi:peroxiredoxin